MVETFTPKSESDLAWFVSQGWTVSVAELFSLHNKETFPSHVFPMSTWIPLFPLLCFLLTRLAKTDTKLAALLLKLHSLNKDGLGPSFTWTKCIKASSWCFKGSPSSALTETCTTSPFNASFNAFFWTLWWAHLEYVMDPWCLWVDSHHLCSPQNDSISNQNLCQTK